MSTVPAWLVALPTVTTLLGGLGGYWLAGRNDEARDKRADARETRSRRAALLERLEEQRHGFQRDTLLELQDQLQRFAHIYFQSNTHDKKTLQETQDYALLPGSLNDDEMQVRIDVGRLNSRVLDTQLRQMVSHYTTYCANDLYILARFREDKNVERALAALNQHSTEAIRIYQTLVEALSVRLRAELDRRYLAADG